MHKQARNLFIIYMVLIILPYLFAGSRGGEERIFGGFLLNPSDGNTYLAKMYEGWRGEWSFTLPFTAEKGNGAFLFLFYLVLGHLSRVTGLSLILLFHIARVFGAAYLFYCLYDFILWIFVDRPSWVNRILALVLFGSGLGWLLVPFGWVTSDLWVAESFPFLSGFANPHFSLGMALLLRIFLGLAKPGSMKAYFWLGIFSVVIAVIMPFGIVIAGCVGGLWLIVEWRFEKILRWKHALAAFLPGGMLVAYQYWITVTDLLLSKWNAQNLTPSPPVWDFLAAFSPALVLAAWGTWRLLREHTAGNTQRLLIVWFFTGLVLIYTPLALQRRFMFGYFIPVGVLAFEGLLRLPKLIIKKKNLFSRIFVIFSVVSNAVVILITVFGVLSSSPNYYLSRDEAAAFSYLRNHTPENAIVVCSPEMGIYLPGATGRRVVYGHIFETVDALQNRKAVEEFYSGATSGVSERAFLTQNRAEYIFIGERERIIGTPAIIADFQPVFQNASVSIYAIQ